MKYRFIVMWRIPINPIGHLSNKVDILRHEAYEFINPAKRLKD